MRSIIPRRSPSCLNLIPHMQATSSCIFDLIVDSSLRFLFSAIGTRHKSDFTYQLLLIAQERSRSGDLLSLQPFFSFHGGLSPQALQIARDGYHSKSATAFLVCHGTVALIEAPIDLDSLQLLGVAHIVDSHVVVLTPEEWNSVKLFATAKNVAGRYLTLTLSNHPVLDANSLAGVRIGPAGGIASCEDSSHAGFEVFVDFDTPIDREPSLLGQNQRRPHAYTQNQEVGF